MTLLLLCLLACTGNHAPTDTDDTDTADTAVPPAPAHLNWIHPNITDDYQQLFEQPEAWATVLANTHNFGMFIDKVNNSDPVELAARIAFLKEHQIPIAVECGGTLNFGGCDDRNGEQSASIEMGKIQHIYDQGGEVTYLTLDGLDNAESIDWLRRILELENQLRSVLSRKGWLSGYATHRKLVRYASERPPGRGDRHLHQRGPTGSSAT